MANEDRIERARNALEYYVTTQLGEVYEESEREITDLLTDLRHLAALVTEESGNDGYSIDFGEAILMSEVHFEAEQEEE